MDEGDENDVEVGEKVEAMKTEMVKETRWRDSLW